MAAGTLELIDREFDDLSEEIDKYVEESKNKMIQGDYDIPLDSKSLEQYMLQKFNGDNRINVAAENMVVSEEVVNELIRFGFTSIQEINDALSDDVAWRNTTYIGVLRDMMIIKDAKKYFEKAYYGDWAGTDRETVDYWNKKTNDNIEKYLNENDIIIIEE